MDELQDKNSIANAIIEENDFDKDGKINFKDFMKVMEKHDEEEDNDLSEIYMKKKTE